MNSKSNSQNNFKKNQYPSIIQNHSPSNNQIFSRDIGIGSGIHTENKSTTIKFTQQSRVA